MGKLSNNITPKFMEQSDMALSHKEIVDAKEALYDQIVHLFEKRVVYVMGTGNDCIFVYGHKEALKELPESVNGIKVTGIEMNLPPIAAI
jgi:hypothetical protein